MPNWEQPSVVVVGAGAMGCLFGGLLAEGGLEVSLYDPWKEHIETVQAKGLQMLGYGGDRFIKTGAEWDAAQLKSADVVFFQCKATHTGKAAEDVKHLFQGTDTLVISFQNGLGNEELLSSILGEERVLGGLTAQGASMEGPGAVRNYAMLSTYIGEMKGELSARSQTLAKTFTQHGLPTEASEDIRRQIWKKLLANIALSATCGIANLSTSEVMSQPGLKEVALRAVEEAAAVATAEGIPLQAAQTRDILNQLVGSGGTGANKSSLCWDIIKKRPTEVDFIYGQVLKAARKHQLSTPVLDTLVAFVKGLESHYMPQTASSST